MTRAYNYAALIAILAAVALPELPARAQAVSDDNERRGYVFSRAPLAEVSYAKLPLGSIEPRGWLRLQLERMADGMAGRLDELYEVVGDDNAWVGGNGDNWERGPYWLDGLVPLAYILEDETLIGKVEKWIEWSLASQTPSGYFGPDPKKTYADDPEGKSGAFIQTNNPADWWPRMVMLKAFRSYYEATGDKRVLDFMTHYFRYQLKSLPDKPLGHWTWWSRMRGGTNQESIYWLYNRTGDEFLLDLAPLVFEQTANWTDGFLEEELPSTHGVNVAMAIQQPVTNFLQEKDSTSMVAVRHALAFLKREHGQPQGMYSGDEPLHGTNPVQGTELCSVVELMYSLERLTRITGNLSYMDHLEKIAYNALPTQHTDDYMGRQYYQQPNQINIGRGWQPFKTGSSGIRICYGLTSGYPCCTVNMHQGWPKYARNLWLATSDDGLAALFYAANTVNARVAGDVPVQFKEETRYPFDDSIRFVFSSDTSVEFPLHLRIPAWVHGQALVHVNGEQWAAPDAGQIYKIERRWRDGDTVTLELPMTIDVQRWHERSASVERGPLVYALRIREKWEKIAGRDYQPYWSTDYEVPTWTVQPEDAWNFGLILDLRDPESSFTYVEGEGQEYPWSVQGTPIKLRAQGKRLPFWKTYNDYAGPLPPSPVHAEGPAETITLIPYGATTLRISEFPVIRKR